LHASALGPAPADAAAAACRHALWLCWASDVAVSAFPAAGKDAILMMKRVFLPLIMHLLLQLPCLVVMVGSDGAVSASLQQTVMSLS